MARYHEEFKLWTVVLLVCIFASPAVASDFWIKKPYQNWSADETQRMLEESPWATTLTLGGVQSQVMNIGAPNNRGSSGEMEDAPSITYTLQFRSARPIREAQVRSAQLNSHYDKMSPAQKAAFDTSTAKFLATTFPDRVIVAVTFHAKVQEDEILLRTYWVSQSLAKLSMTVFLNTKTERLSLLAYGFKDETFQFTFPRPKQLSPDEKISVEFIHPRINAIVQQRILQEFPLKKMLVDGQPNI
jgi:hypothetical protein